jgi:hypothetical protein
MTPPTTTNPSPEIQINDAAILAKNLRDQLSAIVADDRRVTTDQIHAFELIAEAIVQKLETAQNLTP